jgi:tetratricopeptide (TPR) repeat protein
MCDYISTQNENQTQSVSKMRAQARSHRFAGEYQDAIQILEKAAEYQTDQENVFCDLGSINFEIKNYDKGEAYFLMVLQIQPENIFALQSLASYYLRNSDYTNAKPLSIKLIEKNKLLDFHITDLYNLARRNNDNDFIEKIKSLDVFQQRSRRKKITKLLTDHQYREAEDIIMNWLDELDDANLKKSRVYSYLIDLKFAQELFSEANAIALDSISKYPNSISLLLKFTKLSMACNNCTQAILLIESKLAEQFFNIELWEALMLLYHHIGDEENEERAFRHIQKIGKYSLGLMYKNSKHNVLVYIKCLESRGDYKQAEYYREIISSHANLISISEDADDLSE